MLKLHSIPVHRHSAFKQSSCKICKCTKMYQGKCSATLNIIEPCSCHKPCLANSKTLDNGKRKSCGFILGAMIHLSVHCHSVFVAQYRDYSESMWIHVNPPPTSDTIGHHRTLFLAKSWLCWMYVRHHLLALDLSMSAQDRNTARCMLVLPLGGWNNMKQLT